MNPLSYLDCNTQIGIRLRHWNIGTEGQNKKLHRKEILKRGDENKVQRTGSPSRSRWTDLNGPKPPALMMVVMMMMMVMMIKYSKSYIILFRSFFLSWSDLFYLIIIGLGVYCRTWTHSVTQTHTHTHTIGRTPLEDWSASRRAPYLTTHKTHKRQTFMSPVGIRTRNPSKRAAAGPGLRHRGHRNRRMYYCESELYDISLPKTLFIPLFDMQWIREALKSTSRLVGASVCIHS